MAITYEGAGTATANASASSTCIVAYPTPAGGILAGDLLLLYVGTGSVTLPTTPAGWTLTGVSSDSGGTSPSFRFVYKIAAGGESGTQTVATPSAQNQGRMWVFRGVDQTTPLDVAGTVFGSSVGTTAYTMPSLTTTRTGVALIYAAVANGATGSYTPPTVPAAFTETWDSIAANPAVTMGYLIWGSSGATGNVNLVKSNSIRGAAGLVALRPASATQPPRNIRSYNPALSRSFTW